MMNKFLILLGIAFFGWLCWNCEPIRSYSEIPEIKFKKLVFVDSINAGGLDGIDKYTVLSFSFIDGDGDLGVRPRDPDSVSKIHYTWYQKLSDGTYEPFQFKSGVINQEHIIPYGSVMDKTDAHNKTLKGTIEMALVTPSKPQDIDTMRIEFYIVDRAENLSNIEKTPDFSILSETGAVITK